MLESGVPQDDEEERHADEGEHGSEDAKGCREENNVSNAEAACVQKKIWTLEVALVILMTCAGAASICILIAMGLSSDCGCTTCQAS